VAKNLLKPFVSSKRGGMGVGLSICQTIVAAHGGRIWADSTPKGTAFHFTLPVAREE
jgi:two-component system sensor kinase FixL